MSGQQKALGLGRKPPLLKSQRTQPRATTVPACRPGHLLPWKPVCQASGTECRKRSARKVTRPVPDSPVLVREAPCPPELQLSELCVFPAVFLWVCMCTPGSSQGNSGCLSHIWGSGFQRVKNCSIIKAAIH